MALLDLFSKKVNQTSTTNNTDNSRVTTLTDSLNSWVSQNANITQASNRTQNFAFDAIDSFNTVASYNIAGPGVIDPSTVDAFFSKPSSLGDLLNANKISADPNANKYNYNFSEISAGGSEFLKQVQGIVRDSWEGMTKATTAAAGAQNVGSTQSSSLARYVLIGLAVLAGLWFVLKLMKRS